MTGSNCKWVTMILAATAVLGTALPAWAADIVVTDYAELKNAIQNVAQPGDVILVQPGTYTCTDDRLDIHTSGTLADPITIRGVLDGQGNRPVITTSVALNRGVFYFWDDSHDWVVENLEYYECRGPKNAANAGGAYIHGDRITHRNIYAHHCDNGFFSTSDSEDILIEDCIVAYNGSVEPKMMGYTHNFYVNSKQLVVRGCHIHSSDSGQNFKSRCDHLIFEYNWVENDAQYSTEVASNNINNTVWLGNVFIKRTDPGGQRRILNVSDGGLAYGTLTLIGNVVISGQPGDPYIQSESAAETDLVLYNNVFFGPSDNVFNHSGTGTISGSNNYFNRSMPEYEALPAGLTDNIVWLDPGFVDFDNHDFHLTATSVCIDRGLDTPTYLDESHQLADGTPLYEPTTDLPITARSDVGVLDLGAFESSAGGSGPVNQTPFVDAGIDQQITLPTDTVDLSGDVFDDGLPDPPGSLTTTWSKDSGPGDVAFGDPNAVVTTATFSTYGVYVLKLEAYDGALTGSDTCTITVNEEGQGGDDYVASADIPVTGTVVGTYLDTQDADDVYESITETQTGGAPSSRLSLLEHKWTIDVGAGGSSLTFYVQGYKTDVAGEGDDFIFAYSTNDSDYTNMVTITSTVDDDTYLTYEMPSSLTGTVYIRVVDADRTPGFRQRDTVYVDHMFIRVQ